MTDAHGPDARSPRGGRLAWAIGGSLTVVLGALQALTNAVDARGAAEMTGAVIGSILLPLVIAAVLRFGYLRLTRASAPMWAPGLLFTTAAILAVLLLGNVGRAGSQLVREREEVAACARDEPAEPAGLPAGFRYGTLPAEAEREFRAALPEDPPELRTAAQIRMVVERAEPVAVTISMPVRDREAVVRGFLESARRAGSAEPTETSLGTAPATLVRTSSREEGDLVTVITAAGCHVFSISGAREREPLVRDIAGRTLAANPR